MGPPDGGLEDPVVGPQSTPLHFFFSLVRTFLSNSWSTIVDAGREESQHDALHPTLQHREAHSWHFRLHGRKKKRRGLDVKHVVEGADLTPM